MMDKNDNKRALSLRVEEVAQEANAVLLSALSAGATWFAPLPEAVMTAQAIGQIFGLPVVVSACVAASLELIGVNANAAYNDAQEYNAVQWIGATGKRLQNPRNPLVSESRPLWLLGSFYATTTAIVWATAIYNVTVEGAPLIRLLACLFPFASAIGVMVANQRASLRRKVAQEDIEVVEARQAEKQVMQVKKQVVQETLPDYASLDTTAAIKAFYGLHPKAPQAKAAQAAGVSRARVGQVLQALEQEGAIKRNGQGVEIL